jgi:hypothetical protein
VGYLYSDRPARPARRSFWTFQHTKLPSLYNEAQSDIRTAVRQWGPCYSDRTAPSSTLISPMTASAMVVHNMIQRSANQTLEQVILDSAFLASPRLLFVTVCLSGTVASTQLPRLLRWTRRQIDCLSKLCSEIAYLRRSRWFKERMSFLNHLKHTPLVKDMPLDIKVVKEKM